MFTLYVPSSADNKNYAAVTSVIYNGKTGVSDSVITVLEGNGNLKIKPVCAPRPVVETFAPSYIAAGTSFDSSIVLNLGAVVAKESFVRLTIVH